MNKKSSNLFYMIISVLTFIVCIIGATFAYFSASSKSDNDVVNVSSYFVQLQYNDSTFLNAKDLIPSSREVAIKGFNSISSNGRCKDDNNRTVCSIYSFDVTNTGNISQYVSAFLSIPVNGFSDLKYILYNVNDPDNKYIVSQGDLLEESIVSVTYQGAFYIIGGEGQVIQSIDAESTNHYEMLIWLNDTGINQNAQQGSTLSAKITVNITDLEHIKGYVEILSGDEFYGD